MKLVRKITAFFFQKGDPVELELVAAEIKEGRAYLHPKGQINTVYSVKSDEIEIHLSKNKHLSDADIIRIAPATQQQKSIVADADNGKEKTLLAIQEHSPREPETPIQSAEEYDRFRKKICYFPLSRRIRYSDGQYENLRI